MFGGYLKQSTAVTIAIGPFVDITDAFTEETALTLSQADHRLSKNGAAFAQKTEASSSAHMEHGWYAMALDVTDTGTLGRLQLYMIDSGARAVWREYHVLAANIYDAIYGAATVKQMVDVAQWLTTAAATPTVGGVPEVDVTHWIGTAAATPTVAGVPEVDLTHIGGVAQSATDLKDFADTGYDPATHIVATVGTANALGAQAKTDVNTEVVDALNVDTYAQPGQGAPAATTTIRLMLAYLYKAFRNKKTQSATEWDLYNDDAATVDQKSTVSDSGTVATKGEIASGP